MFDASKLYFYTCIYKLNLKNDFYFLLLAQIHTVMAEESKVPHHKKIYEILRKHILTGVYEEGSLLPSENELCAVHNITRPTVRQALEALVKRWFYLQKAR